MPDGEGRGHRTMDNNRAGEAEMGQSTVEMVGHVQGRVSSRKLE